MGFASLVPILYALCSALLTGMALFVFFKNPRSALNRRFALTALCLLLYVTTLYLFSVAQDTDTILLLGRLNFAAIVYAVFFGYSFVHAIALKKPTTSASTGTLRSTLLLGETTLLALVTTFTPLVDRAEVSGTGIVPHITVYGTLFPLYLIHVLAYVGASVILAFQARRKAGRPERDQLALAGLGILSTGVVAMVANVILPYGLRDFRFIDVGPLSSLLFLLAVGYAILRHRLFNIRVFLRKTVVYGLLLSLVLSVYAGVITLVTQRIVSGSVGPIAQLSVLIIAFAFDPLRRFLERRVDHLLFRPASTKRHRQRISRQHSAR